jgi:uncharacterized protein
MIKKSVILTAVFCSFLCCSVSAQNYRPQSPVSDFAGIIDSANKEKMTNVILELERKTSAEIAVVTVKELGNDTIDDFAVRLFKDWEIGKKGKNNGLLIVMSAQNRKIKIEVGYGLEGLITDAVSGVLLDKYALPNFKAGDYGTGLYFTTLAAATLIAQDAGVSLSGEKLPQRQVHKLSVFDMIIMAIIFLLAVFVFIRYPWLFWMLFFGGGRGGRGGGFGGGLGGGGFGGGSSGGGGSSRSW